MRRLFLIFLGACFSIVLPAQPGTILFDHYGPEQGFTTRTSRSVVKTSDGFVWITTEDGLVRYDSEVFRFYRHKPEDPRSIASNRTDQLVAGAGNQLWVVAGGGLDRFNPATGFFERCLFQDGTSWQVQVNPESLYYDSVRNRVWVGTWKGLYVNEKGSLSFVKASTDAASAPWAAMTFQAICGDGRGTLWLGNTYGFFRYDTRSGRIDRYHIPGQDDKVEDDDQVFCLHLTAGQILWIGTWTRGLVRYDISTGRAEQFFYSDPRKEQNGAVCIRSTGLPGEEDLVWLSLPLRGLASFDYRTRRFSFYSSEQEQDKYGIRGQTNGLLPTASEGMWIAADEGLHRYDYHNQLFHKTDLAALMPALKKAYAPDWLGFWKGRDNRDSLALLHIPYLGLMQYDFARNRLAAVPAPLRDYVSGSVFSLHLDKAGVLWVSTDRHGLLGYSWQEQRMLFPPGRYFREPWSWVTRFYEDRQDQLWLATYKGLFMLGADRKEPRPVRTVNDSLLQGGYSIELQAITEDNRGRIWVASGVRDTGSICLAALSRATGRIEMFNLHQTTGVQDMTVSEDAIFIATREGLLVAKMSEATPRFQLLTTKQGLSNDRVEQVVTDREGKIWCSTVFGVSCYIPWRNYFLNYYHHNTNLGPAKNPRLFISPFSHRLYTCQQGALTWCRPDSLRQDPPPEIRVTEFSVFDEPYMGSLADGTVIRLSYRQNTVMVRFAALSFRNAANNQYAYRLRGADADWELSATPFVTYHQLSPGRYVLELKAANSFGLWSRQPVTLVLVIRPPFWNTAWFRLLVILAASALVYGIFRLRLRTIRERYALRNRIATDLHDEIGSTLTSIHILSRVSGQAVATSPEKARQMLEQIAEQSQIIQQNMSDIVWAIRPDSDRVADLLVRMREYIAQTLEPLRIRTGLQVDEALLKDTLTVQERKELLLIYKEAVNNIAKHSGATEVRIELRRDKSGYCLEIADNGRWKAGNSSGTGHRSMQYRAGLLGGSLQVEASDRGTRIVVCWPSH